MNEKHRSIISLLYLCLSFFIALFIISVFFSLLGYWVGGGEDVLLFFTDRIFIYLKMSLLGMFVGLLLWLFYYKN